MARGSVPRQGGPRVPALSAGHSRGLAALASQASPPGAKKLQDWSRPQERQQGQERGFTSRSATPSTRGKSPGAGRGGRSKEQGGKSVERKRRVPAESAPVGASGEPAEAATPEESPPREGEEGPKRRKHKNTGWRKEMPRIFSRHMLGNPQTDSEAMGPDYRKVLKEKMMTHLGDHLDEWHYQREVAPLGFDQYLYDTFFKVNGIPIESFKSDTLWITPGSWYHKAIIDNGEPDQVEHLKDAPPPGRNVQRPSVQALANCRD